MLMKVCRNTLSWMRYLYKIFRRRYSKVTVLNRSYLYFYQQFPQWQTNQWLSLSGVLEILWWTLWTETVGSWRPTQWQYGRRNPIDASRMYKTHTHNSFTLPRQRMQTATPSTVTSPFPTCKSYLQRIDYYLFTDLLCITRLTDDKNKYE